MFSSIKPFGVVFDLDGTLVNSMPMVLAAFTYAIKVFQTVPSSAEIFSKLTGPAENCLRNLLDDERNVPEAMDRLLDYSSRNCRQIVPFDGSIPMLESLLNRRVEVALWTGRDRKSTSEILDSHSLWKYFRVIVCGDDFPSHKPDPEGLVSILDQLSFQSDDVLFVGDSDADVLAGHAISVPTVLIRHERKIANSVRDLCHDWVDTPQQAYDIVLARASTESALPYGG